MIQLSNLNRVMEPETISKNGELSRKKFFECVAGFVGGAVILALVLTMYGCDKIDDGSLTPSELEAVRSLVQKNFAAVAAKGHTDVIEAYEEIAEGNRRIAGSGYALNINGQMKTDSDKKFTKIVLATFSAERASQTREYQIYPHPTRDDWLFSQRFDKLK